MFRYLDILNTIVKQHNTLGSAASVLETVFTIVVDQIFPIFTTNATNEVGHSIYAILQVSHVLMIHSFQYLLYVQSMLLHHSKIFFTTQGQANLTKIFACFNFSFQSEITMFKENLAILNSLNEKQHLYSRPEFPRWAFINTLINSLLSNSYNLLKYVSEILIFTNFSFHLERISTQLYLT